MGLRGSSPFILPQKKKRKKISYHKSKPRRREQLSAVTLIIRRERKRESALYSRPATDFQFTGERDMVNKLVTGETSSLLERVQEKMKLKQNLEEKHKKQHKNKELQGNPVVVPYLPADCIFNIIVRLPLESILISRFVCKSWYGIVNSPAFIDAHLKRSNIGLIFLTPAVKGRVSSDVEKASPSSAIKVDFSVDAKVLELDSTPILHWHLFNPRTQFQIKYVEIKDAKSTDDSQCIGCEIMSVGSGPWRVVDGPPHGFMGWLGYKPVSAIGALHWVPLVDHNEYIVSLPLDDEKFRKIPLPATGGIHDRILEMGRILGFVSHQPANQIDVWVLKSLGGEGWAKQHSITLDCTRNMVPLYCVGAGGELVFKHENDLYAYDQHLQLMRKIEVNKEWCSSPGCYFPHVNSLISGRIKLEE
ncbi:hypothetical protein C2S51_016402 [Perilla frutescens var. frutescens]|nr:hypothetical protein C2S51_016402 [Perilla frutescens var. frutescens]